MWTFTSITRSDPDQTNLTPMEWVALAVSGALLVAFRLHAFDLPLENDECNYAYIGQRLLAGDRLYVDIWDHQPFGVFVLFAGAIAAFGNAPHVFRWMATAFSLVSMVLIFALVRRVAGRGPAILATALFALTSADPGTAGEGCNREIYMNALILAGWHLAMRSAARCRWSVAAAGAALALASLIKTVVAVHWVFLALWLVIKTWADAPPKARLRSLAGTLGALAAAPLISWLACLVYFGASGRLDAFVDAVFLFNLSYSDSSVGIIPRFLEFFTPRRHPFLFDSALPLWIGGLAGTAWLVGHALARRRPGSKGDTADSAGGRDPHELEPAARSKRASTDDRMSALGIMLLVLAGYTAVCLPGRFWPHYYYLMIPALVVASAASAGLWTRRAVGRSARFPAVPVVGTILAVALFAAERRDYLSQPPFGITVKRYNSRDFWGRAQGENVRRVTNPDDRIFVFSNDASIYYYARRTSASRYTMITGLSSGLAGAERRRRQLMAELRAQPPRVIIVLFDEQPFPEWKRFLSEFYGDPVGWDFHDKTGEPIMFVLARKDQPIEAIDWNWDRASVGGWNPGDAR